MSNLMFKREMFFTGRNGMFKSKGLDVFHHIHEQVWISPITSKGTRGRCDIIVPVEDIPALIDILQGIYNSYYPYGI